MPRNDESSIAEFIAWINQLDDPYKVYLFSLINAVILFILLTTGINIDPEALRELAFGQIIKLLAPAAIGSLWNNFIAPALGIFGVIQVGLSIYSIYKYRLQGIIISGCGFFGMLGLLYTTKGLPFNTVWLWLPMIVISWFIARHNSNLEFDTNGNPIFDE